MVQYISREVQTCDAHNKHEWNKKSMSIWNKLAVSNVDSDLYSRDV